MQNTLAGRVAIVTGVSRRAGIGFAVARELLDAGAKVLVQSWAQHDAEQPWGADATSAAAELGPDVPHVEVDFADPDAPERVVTAAVETFGAVDVLVANHARSSTQTLEKLTAAELDLSWAVNARASALLAQSYARAHDDERPGGRIVLFTSGQHLAPMPGELPYAISKGAIHQMTRSLADALADRGITVNTVNPGPVDTGWAGAELTAHVARSLPRGRWGRPADVARLVRWLASDDSEWITGQVIDAEGGFRRWVT
ncbi:MULTISPECIES: SDR family oxidoreductase [Actinomadura]|uniref:SDR family oxidoreductase n=1 Tax=Actinomadura yumaensis TaxID=111807 RepID=A0ABW2D010_9ACTN|nr:SDR family oxidoreductase [Actinomadura sp. J1-007]